MSAPEQKYKQVGFKKHPEIFEHVVTDYTRFDRYAYHRARWPVDASSHPTCGDRKIAYAKALRRARLSAAEFDWDDLIVYQRRYGQKQVVVWDVASDDIRFESDSGDMIEISKDDLAKMLEDKWEEFMILTEEGILIPQTSRLWLRPKEAGDIRIEADESGEKRSHLLFGTSHQHSGSRIIAFAYIA